MRALAIAAGLSAVMLASPAIPERSDVDVYATWRHDAAQAAFNTMPAASHGRRQMRDGAVVRAVEAEARRQGVPVHLAHAVTHVESRFRCDAVGPRTRVGRGHGPLQIMPGSARALGFTGDARRLATCDEGLRYGMKHLAVCWERSGRSYAGAATCHVQGWGRDPHRPVNTYARAYRGWVLAAMPAQPDAGGWLSRGSVAWMSGG